MPPRVDAVIPTFNAPPERLAAAVASALAVPLVDRVIVVDDGSDPPARLGGAAGRVRLVRQENAGPSAARNTGLDLVTADYAVLLDDDDVLIPDGVAAMVGLAGRHGAAAAVAARFEAHPSGEVQRKDVPPEYGDAVLSKPGDVFRPIAIFGASGMLVGRRALDAGLRFDPDLCIGEDRDFLRRAADLGPIVVSSVPALTVRIHDGGRNLSSPAYLARRTRDHLRLLDRYGATDAAPGLRDQTRWLLNALARQPVEAFDSRSFKELAAAARARGWPVPLKSRVRAMLRSLRVHAP